MRTLKPCRSIYVLHQLHPFILISEYVTQPAKTLKLNSQLSNRKKKKDTKVCILTTF